MVVGALLLMLAFMYLKSRSFAGASSAPPVMVAAGGDKVIYVEEEYLQGPMINPGYAPLSQPMVLPQQDWQYEVYDDGQYYNEPQYQTVDGYGQRRVAFG